MIEFVTGTMLPFLFVLTVVVFFHELGHYWVARRCGVRIETFSIGFGPEIIGFNDKAGTRWKLSWIPLGGYVKFWGDANVASAPDSDAIATMSSLERSGSYHHKTPLQRIAISAAGPVANFILAIVIYWALAMSFGKAEHPPIAADVEAGGAAAEAGVIAGDRFVSIDGQPTRTFQDLGDIIKKSGGEPVEIVVERDGAEIPLTLTPRYKEHTIESTGRTFKFWMIGIRSDDKPVLTELGPLAALDYAVTRTGDTISHMLSFIKRLVTGKEDTDQFGGVVRIAVFAGDMAQFGFLSLIGLVAGLSISIGLINLFPIPMLDGGHVLLYTIEAIRGKPLTERALELSYRVGLAFVVALMFLAIWNDVVWLSAS